MPTKSWYKSKTIWFNVLTVFVFLAGLVGYQPNDVLTHNLVAIVSSPLFIAAGNFILRTITKKPLVLSPTDNGVTIDSLPPQ